MQAVAAYDWVRENALRMTDNNQILSFKLEPIGHRKEDDDADQNDVVAAQHLAWILTVMAERTRRHEVYG